MRIIIGLGNPGNRYAGTWHNLGFISMDRFAEKHGLSFKAGKGSYYAASGFFNSEKTVLVKPTTYMNLSGMAVSQVINFYGAAVEDIIVIYDDVNIGLGTIRLRESGSAGGHNGIKSLIGSLGTSDFKRVRIGFRTEHINSVLAANPAVLPDLVLGKIPSSLEPEVNGSVDESVAALEYIMEKGMPAAMNRFNGGRIENTNNPED